jgi:hypothetical protein
MEGKRRNSAQSQFQAAVRGPRGPRRFLGGSETEHLRVVAQRKALVRIGKGTQDENGEPAAQTRMHLQADGFVVSIGAEKQVTFQASLARASENTFLSVDSDQPQGPHTIPGE